MFESLFLYATGIVHSFSILFPGMHLSAQLAAACSTGGAPQGLTQAINNIVNALTGIGAAVCALGIAIGGLMRATSFGSERRISESNTAIACAVVGLLVVLLSQGLGRWVGGLIPPDCNTTLIHLLGSLHAF